MEKSRSLIFLPKISCCFFLSLLLWGCKTQKNISKENRSTAFESIKIKDKYAGLLGVSEKQISNIKLYSFIDEWYGVPYKYAGKSKTGIDCSGFTSVLYQRVYNKELNGTSISIYNQCEPLSKNNLKEGDLVFFKIDGDKISHIGVHLQNNKFVHASTKKGVIINDLNEAYYKNCYYKGGRLK